MEGTDTKAIKLISFEMPKTQLSSVYSTFDSDSSVLNDISIEFYCKVVLFKILWYLNTVQWHMAAFLTLGQ